MIEVRKLTSLEGFNARHFSMNPKDWGFDCLIVDRYSIVLAVAKYLAQFTGDVAFAIVHDEDGDHIIGEMGRNGEEKFILFNCEDVGRKNSTIHGVLKRGDFWLAYEKNMLA